ncbi:TetR/AcrR family transcriptional regulator [Mycobacterium sp.]|uniref:TetR/AcrR family transcriptional regulator n=1 Tax=Mycobacterium sp. TaxID=1785 RepID=UPI003D6A0EF8
MGKVYNGPMRTTEKRPAATRRRNRPNRYPDELLLDAAAEVFHGHGFHDASMVDIAARAGVTKPTLYARLGSKDLLYDRVMERIAQSLIDAMIAGYEGVETEEMAEAIARPTRAFFGWVRANPVGFHLLFERDHGTVAGVDYRDRALGTLTELVESGNTRYLRERGLRRGRATGLVAAACVGIWDHVARWAAAHHLLDDVDPVEVCTALIASGLQGVNPEIVATLRARRRD